MPLATPTGITLNNGLRIVSTLVNPSVGPGFVNALDLRATIGYTDTETAPHFVRITTQLLSGSTPTGAIVSASVSSGINSFRGTLATIIPVLGLTWSQIFQSSYSLRVTVQNVGPSDTSSVATADFALDLVGAVQLSGGLSISSNGRKILFPPIVANFPVVGLALGRFRFFSISAAGETMVAEIFPPAGADGVDIPAVFAENEVARVEADFPSYFAGLRQSPSNIFRLSSTTAGAFRDQLTFVAPAPIAPWVVQNTSVTGARNRELRAPIISNYNDVTWSIDNNPGWLSIRPNSDLNPVAVENFGTSLVGTPPSTGTFVINVTGVRGEETKTLQANLTVVDPVRTLISASSSLAREGLQGEVGEQVNIALTATPSPAEWNAVGLPAGLSIDQNGFISGQYRRPGAFLASVTAHALPLSNYDASAPFSIRFLISGQSLSDNTGAEARSPWLLQQWQLTDLHILARSRRVESTLFNQGSLRIKLGDAINFAILFVDSADAVFALAPEQLRLTIRRADNLDDLIIFKSGTPPASATTQSQTYYLLPVTTGNREREVALEWAEENGKNEPLQCVADIDWVKDGKTYSSRSFPVLLELDVTRP
jgi:hypothetical protein